MNKILILEDNKKLAEFYKNILVSAEYEVKKSYNSFDFFDIYHDFKPDLIILDIKLNNSGMNGIEVFEKLLKEKKLISKVIVLSGEATRSEIAKAMKLGAYTFIEKTGEFNTDKFLADVRQAINLKMQEDSNNILKTEKANLQKELIKQSPLIGESVGIIKVKELIQKFSQAETDILLIGETGTGKEIIADNIYWQSKRAGKPFIKINSGGLTETIVDSELFGHKRGSFTGAISDRKGFFEQANEGILFLNEISNLNYSTQAKILRAIENREIQVVGGPKRFIDVCFIFASNQNLLELVKDKKFREDLYYRLEGNIIDIPPLRERGDDITLLMEHFFNKYSPKYNCYINVELRRLKKNLLSYHWHGNVRELEKFCEYLMIMHDIIDNETILEEFNKKITGKLMKQNETLLHLLKIDNYSKAFEIFEMKYLQFQLLNNNWQVSETADKIGLDRSTLYKKIKKYRIV